MNGLDEKFAKLGVDYAPGQEQAFETEQKKKSHTDRKKIDFSHGDVNAFEPLPQALEEMIKGIELGADQAYTEYKGKPETRDKIAKRISTFTGRQISGKNQLIITPGSQGALFLAMGSLINQGDKVAIVAPDYFANRKIAQFFDATIVDISLDYLNHTEDAGLDLQELEEAFKAGVKLFVFSNPNNPTGVVYSEKEIKEIATLINKYNVTVIADELYARQIFDGRTYTHLCSQEIDQNQIVTVVGPSKTESLSGYRLGVAFGSPKIISRMEKLQAIVSLRAGGYSQAVLNLWFDEPEGWIEKRVQAHQDIRDELTGLFQASGMFELRPTEGGSYLFVTIPKLTTNIQDFVVSLRDERNIIVTPGTEFGPGFTKSFRLNFSQDKKDAIYAVKEIIEFTKKQFNKIHN